MKLVQLAILISLFISCKSKTDKNSNDITNHKEFTQKIAGVWELLKLSYKPTTEPSLINPNEKEYLEIKPDGTCTDRGYSSRWYLSYSDDFIIDSTSKILFHEVSNTERDSWDEYKRTIKTFQIKLSVENGKETLMLTSFNSSGTKVYIRKI